MSVELPDAPEQPKPGAGNQQAKQAQDDGLVNGTSYSALDNLFNIVNYTRFGSQLQYRVGAVAMICNAAGIMAGQAGGNKGGVLEKNYYRDNVYDATAPTADLPTSIEALEAQSRMVNAPPEYGDSSLVSVSKSMAYNPAPIAADYQEYAELTGPPLAPHKEQSRVITNYVVEFDGSGSNMVHAECGWDGIYSINKNGDKEEFLESLFEGSGRWPSRDLRGATKYEVNQIRRQAEAWLRQIASGRANV